MVGGSRPTRLLDFHRLCHNEAVTRRKDLTESIVVARMKSAAPIPAATAASWLAPAAQSGLCDRGPVRSLQAALTIGGMETLTKDSQACQELLRSHDLQLGANSGVLGEGPS